MFVEALFGRELGVLLGLLGGERAEGLADADELALAGEIERGVPGLGEALGRRWRLRNCSAPKAWRPMARAAWRGVPVMASAAMKARWCSAVQPLAWARRGTGVKARMSGMAAKAGSPARPSARHFSQITGMVGTARIGLGVSSDFFIG